MTINAFTMSILQIPCGNIADKYDRRNMVIVGALIGAIAILAIPSLITFWQLLIVLCLLSIGDAIAMVSASAMVVEEGRYLGMGMVMAMFNMAVYLGQAISPVIGGALSDVLSINFSFYAAGVFIFIGAGLFWPLTHRSYRAWNMQSQ
jgi:MFS family permease